MKLPSWPQIRAAVSKANPLSKKAIKTAAPATQPVAPATTPVRSNLSAVGLGLGVAGTLMIAGVCAYKSMQNNETERLTAPTIATLSQTTSYEVPFSTTTPLRFHQEQPSEEISANLLFWQGESYIVSTNIYSQPGELNFTLQSLNKGTINPYPQQQPERNRAAVENPVYVFVPVTNTLTHQPISGYEFPTNVHATRHYRGIKVNEKLTGTASGLEIKLNKPFELATINNHEYHIVKDTVAETQMTPYTNALTFAFVDKDEQRGSLAYALEDKSSEVRVKRVRIGRFPIVFRAVEVPVATYFNRRNPIVQTNTPSSTGRLIE